MLMVGYRVGIRSERRLCEEVHLNLAYRFCRLGLDGEVPDHSTFSKNRHGRFRESDLLRRLFETTVKRCMAEGLAGGDGFAVEELALWRLATIGRPAPGEPSPVFRNRIKRLLEIDRARSTPPNANPSAPFARRPWSGACLR